MKKLKQTILVGIALAFLFFASSALPGNIRSTKHNLSISGSGDITASSERQICIFCHIPHRESVKMPYLWNRSSPPYPYIPYDSSTLNAVVEQPTGSSRMCLSCHDGTIALGAVTSSPTEIRLKGGIRYMPESRPSNLGTNLSDDHPISFVYDTALSLENLELRDPALLHPAVKLDEDNQLQCTSCHDPHDDPFGRFLVMDNMGSALCTACHDKRGWNHSAHSRSTAELVRTGGLWENTGFRTVAENGCENCHLPHSSGAGRRLLNYVNEEDNCLSCHDGSVASSNIEAVLFRRYGHRVQNYQGIHDAAEDFTLENVSKHVECTDCHNAHQANDAPSLGGSMVSGATRGASGVSAGGSAVKEARYVYEICFKCHADNNVIDALTIMRQHDQLNTREEFDPANPSFHPVEAPGKNPNVISLLPPYTASSIISCTDCHGNSDPSAVPGPHGSDYPHLLIDRYITDDFTPESSFSYALCYKCHSQSILMNEVSFPHKLHVVDQKAPCSACHDPHGVSSMQGNALHNSHLINFDLSIVSPDNTGRLEFNDLGRYSGECFLNCHGKLHNPDGYPL